LSFADLADALDIPREMGVEAILESLKAIDQEFRFNSTVVPTSEQLVHPVEHDTFPNHCNFDVSFLRDSFSPASKSTKSQVSPCQQVMLWRLY